MGFPQVNGDQVKANTIINKIEDNLNSADKIEVSVKEASEDMEPSLVERLKALAANEDFEDEHLGKSTEVSPQKDIKMAKVPEGVGVATEAEYQISEINAEVPQTKITGEITQNQAAGENIGRNDPSYFKGIVYLDENPGAFAYIASAEINGKEMPIEKGCKTSDEFYDYLKKLGEVVKLGRVNTMFGEKLDTYRKSLHDYNSAEEELIGDTRFKAGDHVRGKDSAGNIITGKVLHPGYWAGDLVIEVDNPRKIPRRSPRNMHISDDDFRRMRNEARLNQVAHISEAELIEESATEDTVKQGSSWVNKGKEGTHGKFKTKKAADAQRKAMFANGYTANEEMDEYELATSLNNLIRDEYEAIDGYNDMISDLEENEQNKDLIPVLDDINNEENTHVGQLQEALKTVSPAADHISKGELEAEGQLRGGEAMEEYKEEMYGFEAMSTPDLESFQAVIADKLNKEGSITVLDILMDRDLSYDFTEQMNFIKNTMDLSNTNEILNEILKAAETLLDDIQIEELVEEFSSDTLEEGEEVDQEFGEYEEPEDWSKVDEEEVVEEEPVEPKGEEPTV